jgi:UDP-galactose transporter
MPPVNGQRYHASTSVFLNEIMKLGISLTVALYERSQQLAPNTPATTLFASLASSVFTNESWKLAIPAAMYTLQNTLQYVAVSNLDAATFQVTYQLKILTTALFSVLLLGRTLTSKKWMSLVLLIVGVSIVQFPGREQHADLTMEALKDSEDRTFFRQRSLEKLRDAGVRAAAHLMRRSATYEGIDDDVAMQQAPPMNASVGLAAVLVSCALSGLAGVFFEKILKQSNNNPPTSLWVRNCQLSFWSLFPSFFGVAWVDGDKIAKTGFFAGYNGVVWMAILLQGLGGVVVSLVINYADNIAKNFATSISIILSCLASVYFFDFKITFSYLTGTAVVLFSTYLYSKPERGQLGQVPPLKIADYEKTTIDGNPKYYEERKSPSAEGTLSTSRPGSPTIERQGKQSSSKRDS